MAARQNLSEHLWKSVSQTLRKMKAWHLKNETRCPGWKKNISSLMKIYLISVSSSTITSHLVFGTEVLRNLWRIANVFPQWPANTDKASTDRPVWLNHILTLCCVLVYKDKWPLLQQENTFSVSSNLDARTRRHTHGYMNDSSVTSRPQCSHKLC